MKKRTKIKICTFFTALALVFAGFWADAAFQLASTRQALEYNYQRALGDLTDYVAGLQSTLQKAPYVGTGVTQNGVSAQLLEQSGGAKAAMAALPLSQERTEKLSRFLSQVGDYALSLSRRSARGEGLSDEDMENLQFLEEYAGKLLNALKNAQARLSAEDGSIYTLRSRLANLEELDSLATLDDDFDEAAKEFSETPSLLYDGPFSDHLNRREPLFLKGREEITKEQAAQIAAEFLQCEAADLTYTGEGGSELPVYAFGKGGAHVNVSKAGGEITYFKLSAKAEAGNLDYVDALILACRFLDTLGREAYRETYYVISDNLCTINFAGTARTEDGQAVVCYPDLMKVTVELEQGGTVEYDAAGYLMNCRERDIPAPELTQEEAAASLSPRLTVTNAALAVIPTPGLDEVLCWEFRCTASNGQEFLAYVNAHTGIEEQLYRLQIDEHGALAQ